MTPVVHSGFQEILRLHSHQERPYVRSSIGRILDRVLAAPEYLASLPQDQVLAGALTSREVAEHETIQRGYESAMRNILERTDAHVERLGEGYRQRIYAEAVKERVNEG